MKKTVPYIALVISLIAGVCVFLPWLRTEASGSILGFGAHMNVGDPLAGIKLPGGIPALIIALAGGTLALFKIKWSFVAGIANLINGLGYAFGWFKQGVKYESSVARAGLDVIPLYGLILFLVTSALFVVIALLLFNADAKNSRESYHHHSYNRENERY